LSNYGSEVKYSHDVKGFNSRLDDLQASFLRAKLKVLSDWNLRRKSFATKYLRDLQGLNLTLPMVPEWCQPVWHLFVIKTSKRQELKKYLESHGIETVIHYPIPPHMQGAYMDLNLKEGSLPISERLHRDILSLPLGPHLLNQEYDFVINTIKNFFEEQ
jgi:dTDP-4-amino-4,6-dideoxygalactose transaminase